MQLLPLVGIFVVGVVLRIIGVLGDRHSSWLLRCVFYIGLPVVIFLAIVKVDINESLLYFALLPPVIIGITFITSLIFRRSLLRKTRPKTFASMVAAAAILNLSFLYPFVQTSYGAEGLARLAVIDCFNAIMIFSLLYVITAGLVQHRPKVGPIVSRVLVAPTLWALVVGIIFRVSGAELPSVATAIFEPAALLVSWTLLLALGIKFRWHVKNPPVLMIGILLRLGIGACVGIGFIKVFALHGLDAEIILVASMAPMGLNSITLAEIEKLDIDFAVSAVSVGLVIGIVTVPVIIHLADTIKW